MNKSKIAVAEILDELYLTDPEIESRSETNNFPSKWHPAMPSPNPHGRPKVGLSLSESCRAFLEQTSRKRGGLTRLRKILDALYLKAINPNDKQSVPAANILLTRGYGSPMAATEKEIMLTTLNLFPSEVRDKIAEMILPDGFIGLKPDDAMYEDESQDDDLPAGMEEAKFEEIPPENGSIVSPASPRRADA